VLAGALADSEDAPCKDAKQTLMRHGRDVVRECIEAAEPTRLRGCIACSNFADRTISLYRDGRAAVIQPAGPHRRADDDSPGEMSVVTGIPNSGKSEFADAVTVNLAHQYGWRFAVCSFENPPAEHIAKLAEKHLGLPFWDGPRSE